MLCPDQVPHPDTYRGKYTDLNSPGEDLGQKYADDVREVLQAAAAKGRSVAAFYAESLQSCAGQIIPPPGYLKEVYKQVQDAGGPENPPVDSILTSSSNPQKAMFGVNISQKA